MAWILGIDGGQSSTTALIADETGRIVGTGRSGPCNHVAGPEGRPKFIEAVGGCVRAACSEAGIDADSVEFIAACAGFSGGPADKEVMLREMIRTSHLLVTTDALIALAGATGGEPGIITVAGTGSISWGRNREGQVARAGGWGYIFGDEGGGFDLARQALRAVLRHEEGWGPPTCLSEMLLAETGAPDANELMHRFYTAEYSRPRIASYSRLVDTAAKNGDAVARQLLLNAAQQLATATSAVRSQLFGEDERATVCWVGGVFRSELLLDRFRMLVELQDGNCAAPPRFGPAAGAVIEAGNAAGIVLQLTEVPAEKS